MSSDKIEFEDDAPLELTDSDQLQQVSEDELRQPSRALDKVFEKEKKIKEERNAKIKEKPEPLKLRNKRTMKENYKPKDYIAVECQICQREYTHAKQDEKGSFLPYALCQHIVFKGVFLG